MSRAQWIALLAGPAAALVLWVAPTPAGMSLAGQSVAGLAVWMAVWWLSAVVPLAATALLPLVVLPAAGASASIGS